jgi:hypothetical protein
LQTVDHQLAIGLMLHHPDHPVDAAFDDDSQHDRQRHAQHARADEQSKRCAKDREGGQGDHDENPRPGVVKSGLRRCSAGARLAATARRA